MRLWIHNSPHSPPIHRWLHRARKGTTVLYACPATQSSLSAKFYAGPCPFPIPLTRPLPTQAPVWAGGQGSRFQSAPSVPPLLGAGVGGRTRSRTLIPRSQIESYHSRISSHLETKGGHSPLHPIFRPVNASNFRRGQLGVVSW
jgi:hypothetical protein